MRVVEDFSEAMDERIGAVFAAHPALPDHRREHPWLKGWLGDSSAPVWLVAENPSATQVDRIHSESATVEAQWAASRGDRLLREALVEHGLKRDGPMSPGGWNCYITDVMKSEVFVRDWHGESQAMKDRVAELWSPVLAFELATGSPRVIIVLGGNAERALRHLSSVRLLPELPAMHRVHHYSYVMSRPAGSRAPGDPARQVEWKAEIGRVAALVDAQR